MVACGGGTPNLGLTPHLTFAAHSPYIWESAKRHARLRGVRGESNIIVKSVIRDASLCSVRQEGMSIVDRSIFILLLALVLVSIPAQGYSQPEDPPIRLSGTYGVGHVMDSVREVFTSRNFMIASGVALALGGDDCRSTVEACLKSAALTELVVSSLKYTTNRQRPQGSHSRLNSSFPSSHAAAAFTVAACISERYPSFAVPSYSLAALIASSRIYHKRHYPSDVLVGALLGIGCARISESYLGGLHLGMDRLASRPAARIDHLDSGGTTLRLYVVAGF